MHPATSIRRTPRTSGTSASTTRPACREEYRGADPATSLPRTHRDSPSSPATAPAPSGDAFRVAEPAGRSSGSAVPPVPALPLHPDGGDLLGRPAARVAAGRRAVPVWRGRVAHWL